LPLSYCGVPSASLVAKKRAPVEAGPLDMIIERTRLEYAHRPAYSVCSLPRLQSLVACPLPIPPHAGEGTVGHERALRLEYRADTAPAVGRRRRCFHRLLAVGARVIRRVHQRDPRRRHRRHVDARRARLIRHRRRAGAALASPATEERAAAGLLFIRARRLFALPALAQGGRMKLIGALCSLGSWRDRRRGRRLRWLDRGRHLRLRAVLDDRPMILAG